MAKPKAKDIEYVKRAEGMSWKGLHSLWEQIKQGTTPGWEEGKALEHLVVRAFRLSKLEAEYPYDVPPGGKPIEQIDGLVHLNCYTFLIECKDTKAVDIEAIAKLRNQLLRRPETTFGCVFTKGDFTSAALVITDFSVPHRILLWSELDIEDGLRKKDFASMLLNKYRHLCKYGLTDHSPNYKGIQGMNSAPALTLIVDGPDDAQLLRAVLGKELAARLRFFAGQGRVSLATLARNILVHEGGPVLIVMDSDTLNPRLTEELRAMARMAMGGVSPDDQFQAFSFVPEIEVVFFEAPDALERLLGRMVPEATVEEGLLIPNETLTKLLVERGHKSDYLRFIESIDPTSAESIAAGKQAAALRTSIDSLLANALIS